MESSKHRKRCYTTSLYFHVPRTEDYETHPRCPTSYSTFKPLTRGDVHRLRFAHAYNSGLRSINRLPSGVEGCRRSSKQASRSAPKRSKLLFRVQLELFRHVFGC